MLPGEIFEQEEKPDGLPAKKWLKGLSEKYQKNFKTLYRSYHRYHKHKALAKEVKEVGIPLESVSHYWRKGKHFSIFAKTGTTEGYFDIRDQVVESMKDHAPTYTLPILNDTIDPHLLVLDPADIHIGKLARAIETGEEYNTEIAVNRVLEGVAGLISKSAGFNIDKILLIIGNDILHVDNAKRTTTSGTAQDTDGMWYDNFLAAKELYVKLIETLMYVAPVHVQYDPSNHDFTNGFFLADTISSWFSNVERVTFNITPSHRKYFRYGNSLIGTSHGDGAKQGDLPILMATEASAYWHECNHRYWYLHHLHHKVSKEIVGVTIETLRSPSGTDSWHHRNGYQHNAKAVEAFIHHHKFGQVARLTHIF